MGTGALLYPVAEDPAPTFRRRHGTDTIASNTSKAPKTYPGILSGRVKTSSGKNQSPSPPNLSSTINLPYRDPIIFWGVLGQAYLASSSDDDDSASSSSSDENKEGGSGGRTKKGGAAAAKEDKKAAARSARKLLLRDALGGSSDDDNDSDDSDASMGGTGGGEVRSVGVAIVDHGIFFARGGGGGVTYLPAFHPGHRSRVCCGRRRVMVGSFGGHRLRDGVLFFRLFCLVVQPVVIWVLICVMLLLVCCGCSPRFEGRMLMRCVCALRVSLSATLSNTPQTHTFLAPLTHLSA